VEFKAVTPWGEKYLKVNIPGKFTVYNALASLGVCLQMGIPFEVVAAGLEKVSVPGRAEVVETGKEYTVMIDYAHTPDSLENILTTVKGFAPGRVVSLFGCGGDRDRTKRPVMGEISGRIADFTIITSDNPRTEDPLTIIKEIEEGIKNVTTNYEIIVDRREAIRKAILMAKRNDCIVIAGKGHEDYQIIGKEKFHFSDREEALKIISSIQIEKKVFPQMAIQNLLDSIEFSINYSEKLTHNWLIIENIIQLIKDIYMLKNKETLHRSVVEFLIDYQEIFTISDIKTISRIEKGLRTKKEFYELEKIIEENTLKNLLSKIKMLLEKIKNEIDSSNV
ncbi:MAG: UDP-N-acetylmuramyl-tripeptide synthetase, partial [Brevinematales bacterium]|nr:UDP-N-acetylmuramyl-tripeptide synthetase [Brevinematales bacterium]